MIRFIIIQNAKRINIFFIRTIESEVSYFFAKISELINENQKKKKGENCHLSKITRKAQVSYRKTLNLGEQMFEIFCIKKKKTLIFLFHS